MANKVATGGQMLIDGQDLYANFDAYRPLMAYMPQAHIIHRELPVDRVLWYAAKLRLPDANESDIQARIKDVLQKLEMTRHTAKRAGVLSWAQRQRLSIAIELLTDPNLLFLNEPTTALDPGETKEIMSSLRQVADEGKTVVLSKFDTIGLEFCDMIAFMSMGRVAFYGSPDEAKQFFNVHDLADIYMKLEQEVDPVKGPQEAVLELLFSPSAPHEARGMLAGVLWSEHYHRSEYYQKYVTARQQQLGKSQLRGSGLSKFPKPGRGSLWHQSKLLTSRYMERIWNNKPFLFFWLFMMPFLASTLMALASSEINVTRMEPTAPAITQLLTILALVVTQVSTYGAAYEIAKEWAILRQERAANLRITAYFLSKLFVLAALAVIPVTITLLLFSLNVSFNVEPVFAIFLHSSLELFVSLWLAALASISFGLFISSKAFFEDMVRHLLLAQLFLQILLAGTWLPLFPKTLASQATISYWTIEALASTGSEHLLSTWGALLLHTAIWAGLTMWGLARVRAAY